MLRRDQINELVTSKNLYNTFIDCVPITFLMLIVVVVGILMLTFIASIPYSQPAEARVATANLSNNAGFSSDPHLVVSGSNVYVVWEDFTPGNWEILFKASNDSGATFRNTVNLSNDRGESARPRIAVSGSNVYVAWQEFTSRSYDIFFRASNDNGMTFGSAVKLNKDAIQLSDPKRSDPPHIAVYGKSVYVTWVDSDGILLRASNDSGASFGDAVNLSNSAPSTWTFLRPHLAVSNNNVYVVWVDSRDIIFRASSDNGMTFGSPVNLSVDNKNATAPERSDLPDIAVRGTNVYVVWVDYTPRNYDIFFRASSDNGASFGDAVELTNVAGLSDLPRIAVSDENVHVVWDDYNLAEGLDIFLRTSTDNGASFSNAINLNRNTGYSTSTPIAVSGSNVYVVASVGNIDIFFRASNDNGASFSDAVNLSNNAGGSSDPSIAVSGSNVYIVWEDYAPGNADIFFMKFLADDIREELETLILSTGNESVTVEVTIDEEILETAEPVQFTLRFLDPTTGEQLQAVNYSFMITNEKGDTIANRTNEHAHEGTDTQVVTFSNTGAFTLTVDVAGLGMDKPYDSKYNGKASTTLTVVPEFPLGIFMMMALVVGAVIALTRLKNPLVQSS